MNKQRKLNIVFLDFDDIRNPLLGAGQANATFQVGKRLVKRGHRVIVYSSKYPGYKDRKESGIEYRHIGAGSNNIKLNNVAYILLLPFIVTAIKADIIVECFTAPISTLFTPVFTNIPVIGLPSMFNAKEFSQKYNLPFHWVEWLGIKYYKYLLPYSETDSSKARRMNSKIIYKIVHQGVSKEYLKIKQKKPKHILFVGRLDIDQKGIDLLLKSYSKVRKSIKYPLVIAGHGPDEERIKKLINELKLENFVKFVGPAYGRKKIDLMSEALYVVFPSRHDEMCLWTLEALAAGLPLVCFDLPESKWLNGKVSIKANPFSLNDYAKLLIKATNMRLISKMRKESRRFARQFSWEKVTQEFESFFSFVLTREGIKSF
ncbi:glycosyltransferase [Candidatus Daviesbacteria bacterium]|nr:glycosyltransferase [Candidatus Daviesbacteria bacterium]